MTPPTSTLTSTTSRPTEAETPEPLFVDLPEPSTPTRSAAQRRPFVRRHRVALTVTAALVVVLVAGAGVFVYAWNHSGPHALSPTVAYQRFRSGSTGQVVDPGTLQPAQGVYTYAGHGSSHISVPPKSQVEGPTFPGTVSYLKDGCWVWRVDYSDSHWQSSTFCPLHGNLVQVARGGWYRWNFVALSVADTATFTCSPEIALPAVLSVGQRFPFTCTGSNSPIKTDPVHMKGTNTYLGVQTVQVGTSKVTTLHFRETSTFSGGQWGTNVSDLWISTVNGLPVKGSWSTKVSSPTFLGTSTLTGSASFTVQSLTPQS